MQNPALAFSSFIFFQLVILRIVKCITLLSLYPLSFFFQLAILRIVKCMILLSLYRFEATSVIPLTLYHAEVPSISLVSLYRTKVTVILLSLCVIEAALSFCSSVIALRWFYVSAVPLKLLHHSALLLSLRGGSIFLHRLIGLVVNACATRAEDPGFESRLRRDFIGVESYQ